MSSEKTESTKLDNKESKDKDDQDIEPEKVHSANKWEKVDMGDDGRKKKFLRLMGAAKTEHHGRFVIGEEKVNPHDRDSPEDEIEDKLEDQYKQGLEHKLLAGPKGHIGLGFHDDPKKKEETENKEESDKNVEEKNDEKVAEKHKLEEESDSQLPAKKKFMTNFVKASDS